jgi:hypothetical protein
VAKPNVNQLLLDFTPKPEEGEVPSPPDAKADLRFMEIVPAPGVPGELPVAIEGEPLIPGHHWVEWLARPDTPENQLADLTLQIKRDLAVLAGDPAYYGSDRAFYEKRIEGCRADARRISAILGTTT